MGARHGPPPARPPGEARPGLGRRRGRPRAAGAGGAAAAGTAGRGAARGLGARGRGGAAAGALGGGSTVGARAPCPRPPAARAMGAPALLSRSSLVGARPRKAGAERPAGRARPGEGAGEEARGSRERPGKRWVCMGARRVAGAALGVPLGDQGDEGGGGQGLDSRRNQLAPSQSPSEAASAFSHQPAKGGVWPAMGAGGVQAGEIPSIYPLAAGNGFQEFSPRARLPGRRAGKGPQWPTATPSWVTAEKQPGEGLVESGTDLGLEMLQKWHLRWFPMKYKFGLGGVLGKGRLGRKR